MRLPNAPIREVAGLQCRDDAEGGESTRLGPAPLVGATMLAVEDDWGRQVRAVDRQAGGDRQRHYSHDAHIILRRDVLTQRAGRDRPPQQERARHAEVPPDLLVQEAVLRQGVRPDLQPRHAVGERQLRDAHQLLSSPLRGRAAVGPEVRDAYVQLQLEA